MDSSTYNFRTRCHNIVQQWAVSLALGQNHRPISPSVLVGTVSSDIAATKQSFPGLSTLAGTPEDDNGEEYNPSCASVTSSDHEDGSLGSHPSTKVLTRISPAGEIRSDSPLSSSSESSSSSGESSSWGLAGPHESSIAAIARRKLGGLSFRGEIDGGRFMGEFEKLIDRVQGDMSDEDKRILLVSL